MCMWVHACSYFHSFIFSKMMSWYGLGFFTGSQSAQHHSATHTLNESKITVFFSRLLTVWLQLDQLPTRILIFTLFYILMRGNIFADVSTMSTALLYFELSFVIPSLTPVRASLQPSSVRPLLSPSSVATPSFNLSSTLIVDNYLPYRDLSSTISSDGLKTMDRLEPSTANFILSSSTTDVLPGAVKGPVPDWYKQGTCSFIFSRLFLVKSTCAGRSSAGLVQTRYVFLYLFPPFLGQKHVSGRSSAGLQTRYVFIYFFPDIF